jgi:DNA adenine methylase
MGSKNRIAKHILPIMLAEAEKQNITTWMEPFVGGANMIDKVPDSFERVGYDLNDHVIHALIDIRDNAENLPDTVSEYEYKSYKGLPPQSITSWVRIACAYGGIFESKLAADKTGLRNYAKEAKNNALKQSPKIQGVEFICCSYLDLTDKITNSIIYCDPPYQGTTGYKTGQFNHEEFFNWCRLMKSKGNVVFMSEYNAPEDFELVWQGEIKTNFSSTRKSATHKAVEKLFKV